MDTRQLRLFDDAESALVTRGLKALSRASTHDADALRGQLRQLIDLSNLVRASPSLREPDSFAGKQRSEETLIEHLCENDGLSGELALPLKATLSRTFLIAKIQFLRGFVQACAYYSNRAGDELSELDSRLRDELAQSIYTQLAEELLLALLRKPDVRLATKRRAAEQLIQIWENAQVEIDDFCPLLESAWRARNRVNADLGSLLGTSEYFRLVCEDCPSDFLSFFARDEVSLQQKQAFEEFLFDMTFEEVATLRTAMRNNNVEAISVEWAEQVLGRKIERERVEDRIDPIALYRSYFRRQLAADFRIVAGRPGPRRTAEAYMMIYLLDHNMTARRSADAAACPHPLAPLEGGRARTTGGEDRAAGDEATDPDATGGGRADGGGDEPPG